MKVSVVESQHITLPPSEMEEKVISQHCTTFGEPIKTEETEDYDFLDGVQVYIESAVPEETESEQSSSHLGDNGVPQRKRCKGLIGELSDLKAQIHSVDERNVAALESIASSLKIIAEGQKELVALFRTAVGQRP